MTYCRTGETAHDALIGLGAEVERRRMNCGPGMKTCRQELTAAREQLAAAIARAEAAERAAQAPGDVA